MILIIIHIDNYVTETGNYYFIYYYMQLLM